MKKIGVLLLAPFVAMTVTHANAQFTLVPLSRGSQSEPPPASAPLGANRVAPAPSANSAASAPTQFFTAPTDSTQAQGFGIDVPLVLALQQIVPSPWRVSIPETEVNRIVSWQGGSPWPTTVEKLAESIGLTVAWGQGLVHLRSASTSPTPGASTVASMPATLAAPTAVAAMPPVATSANNQTPVNPPTLQASATSAPAQNWVVTPGSFRGVLRDWAQRAKWNVIFIGDIDYEIESGATFTGDFVEAATALVRAFRGTDRPSTIEFYRSNNTAVVKSTLANGD